MKCTLSWPVPTNAVLTAFGAVLARLKQNKELQHDWVVEVIRANPLECPTPEYGAVLYPKGKHDDLIKDRRIVLSPIPDARNIKVRVLEIGFGHGMSFAPLSGFEDAPRRGIFSPDRKYVKDFMKIVAAFTQALESPHVLDELMGKSPNSEVAQAA